MQGRGREDTAYRRPCLPRNKTPRQREREEGSRRDFTGGATAPNASPHPSSVRVTRLPLVLPKPLRHLAGLAVGRSARSSTCPFATTEPGARAAGRAGAGDKQDPGSRRGQQGRYFCRLSASKPSAADPEDLPCS